MNESHLRDAYVPDAVGDDELAFYEKAGFGERLPWGDSPAVLVVDMTEQFTRSEFDLGREDAATDAVEATARLLAAAREADYPVVYTRGPSETDEATLDAYRGIMDEKRVHRSYDPGEGNEIDSRLDPDPGNLVIEKAKPSAFFDTHLAGALRHLDVDTVLVAGMTTSGCVRATVVDAYSHNFRPIVPQEAVADRSPTAHEATLFDIDMKYGNVTPLEAVLERL